MLGQRIEWCLHFKWGQGRGVSGWRGQGLACRGLRHGFPGTHFSKKWRVHNRTVGCAHRYNSFFHNMLPRTIYIVTGTASAYAAFQLLTQPAGR